MDAVELVQILPRTQTYAYGSGASGKRSYNFGVFPRVMSTCRIVGRSVGRVRWGQPLKW